MPDKPAVVALLLAVALVLAGWRAWPLARPMLRAPSDARWDRLGERLAGIGSNVGLHRRLLNIRYAGVLHAMIFSGFLVLFTAIVQAFGHGLFPSFSLEPVGGETWIALLQEVFAVLILAALGMAAYQRFVLKPARFKGSSTRDATIIYALVTGVVATMLLEFAFRLAATPEGSAWRPLSSAIAAALRGLGVGPAGAAVGEAAFYWAHLAVILGFLVFIPGSKHRHIFTAIPNIFFRSLAPRGVLPAPREGKPGLESVGDLSWKHMLDLYSCTECGRCQAACPAYAAGQPLSPKLLIMDLRDRLMGENGAAGEVPSGPVVGGTIAEATLWACTTCRACMEVCPIHIEHVPKIVDMRRTLVEEAKVQPMLQAALGNLQQYGNSHGKPARMRARWTKDLKFKIKDARKEPVDVLWFVGDYASYDPRALRLTLRMAELLHAAGVDFGILYDAERNSGNDVRRVGEEGLFDMLARANIEALAGCTFNRILTTDPHSLNALKQEYAALGARYTVVHHTELLLELVEQGHLAVKRGEGAVVTYHDPCYLGRYNRVFDAPRALIARLGYRLHEMPRSRTQSFCCGAGGGRIWGDDTGVVERPSENRIKEALALGDATAFVVACPKDTVMYSAATQALGVQDKLPVRDVIDLVELTPATAPAAAAA